ncbi:MAG: acyltransferase [Clostridiales Family XIII bacterium]|nr:acyltransferase [Clostridia bacterium]MDE8733866.1 acyltransferase [Eubacteriales bacterium DFI.9.88]MDY3011060.1 acyltransferase [Clostridiales Family XIII bacterium]
MYMPKENELMSEFMGSNVKKLLKYCGKEVMIFPMAKIVSPDRVEIGDHSRLCDYVFIHTGYTGNYKIGRYTDLEPFTCLWAGGDIVIGNFVNVAPAVVFLSAKFEYKNGSILTSVIQQNEENIQHESIIVEDHVLIGTHSTIMAGVHIGEGAIIGANSLVNKDLDPWGVYVGNPIRKIGERPKDAKSKAIDLGL